MTVSLSLTRQAAAAPCRQPLVVDLDGSLVQTDMLIEGLLAGLKSPLAMAAAVTALRRGKAAFKQAVAGLHAFDPAALPYNQELLAFLREEQANGRQLVLATGADRQIAVAVAQHLDLFDAVLASDGETNLTGAAKLEAISDALDGRPFAYIGNARADLAVWRGAEAGVTVNARPRVARAAALVTRIERDFAPARSWPVALLHAMRPHQWVKNLLVFVPIVTARAIGDVSGWLEALVMFAAFCCTASGIYLINDLCDLNADRRHPKKSARALASGALPLPIGIAAAPILIALGWLLSLQTGTAAILTTYAGASLAYSLALKAQPVVDVFLLAALYLVRLIGGGAASGYPVSLWLLAFASFLFLSLALVKRVAELRQLAGGSEPAAIGRGYVAADRSILELMGVAASFVSALVLALYVQTELIGGFDKRPTLAWVIVPLLLLWQCRLWFATSRGEMHHDPIIFAARDWVSWLVAAGCFGVVLLGRAVDIATF